MAQLPGNGDWLIQQIGEEVILFQRYTEQEIARFNPHDSRDILGALAIMTSSNQLDEEQKFFACFWSGYFYAHATGV